MAMMLNLTNATNATNSTLEASAAAKQALSVGQLTALYFGVPAGAAVLSVIVIWCLRRQHAPRLPLEGSSHARALRIAWHW